MALIIRTMPVIYLDTSHLHLLAEARRTNQDRFSQFLAVWKERSCTLALTMTHIQEICRYQDQPGREERYHLLKDLLPIRCDLVLAEGVPVALRLLHNREIYAALMRKGMVSSQGEGLSRYTEGLPELLTEPAQIELYKQLETVDVYRNFIEAFYDLNKVSAEANSRKVGTNYERHRLSKIQNSKLKPEHIAEVLQKLEEGRTNIPQSLRNVAPQEIIDEQFDKLRDLIELFANRVREVGNINALAEFLEVDTENKTDFSKHTDVLNQEYVFKKVVQMFLDEVCDLQDEAVLETVTQRIVPEDCPGWWLKHAVLLQMRKATAVDEASNYSDLEHLSYLPYVDLFFADKRIAEFTRQVLASPQLPVLLRDVGKPVAIPKSIGALESILLSRLAVMPI